MNMFGTVRRNCVLSNRLAATIAIAGLETVSQRDHLVMPSSSNLELVMRCVYEYECLVGENDARQFLPHLLCASLLAIFGLCA